MRILLVALLIPSLLLGQSGRVSSITGSEIDGYLRFLSSDLLEGRAPATRGGRLAAEYIASQLRAFGLRPGLDTSYFQTVPIGQGQIENHRIGLTRGDFHQSDLGGRRLEETVARTSEGRAQKAANLRFILDEHDDGLRHPRGRPPAANR